MNLLDHHLRRKIVTTILILAVIPLSVLMSQRTQELRRRAAAGPATLHVLPSSQVKSIGETGTVDILLNPNGANVASVELVLSYDPQIIGVTNITPGTFFTSVAGTIGNPVEITKDLSTPGRVHYALGFPLGSGYSSSTIDRVAVMQFVGKSPGTATIAFVVSGTPQTIVGDVNAQNVLNYGESGTVNVSSGARLYFSQPNPANPQPVGGTFTLDVFADSGGQAIGAVDAKIRFENAIFDAVAVEQGTEPGFTSYPALEFNNSTATVYISANIGSGASPTPVSGTNLHIGQLTLKAVNQTSRSPVSFLFTPGERNDSNIVLSGTWQTSDPVDILASVTNMDIVVGVVPSPSPTIIPTPTPTPTPKPPTPTPTPTPTPAPPSPTPTPVPPGSNVAPNASVSVSSEYSANYAGIKAVDGIIGQNNTGEWASKGEVNPWIQLDWPTPVILTRINLYDRVISLDHSEAGTLTFSDGSSIVVTNILDDGTVKEVLFTPRSVSSVRFQIEGAEGSFNNGLSEFEAFTASVPTPTPIPPTPTPTRPPPTPTPTPTPTKAPTPTPTPPTSLSVTLKLRFQGRLRTGASNAKTVTLRYKPIGGTPSSPVTFTTNANGEGTLNLPPGNYIFLIDADGYLARRFGSDANPIAVSSGAPSLDLSSSPLAGGDFNNDGEVNEVDYTSNFLPFFLSNFSLVDLDGSGEVNNLDFAVMRGNWNLLNDSI